MIVDELQLVGWLGEVDPLPGEALDAAELVLRAAMAVTKSKEAPRPAGARRHLGRPSGREGPGRAGADDGLDRAQRCTRGEVFELQFVGLLGEVDPLPGEALDAAELVLRAAMAGPKEGRKHPGRRGLRWRVVTGLAAATVVSASGVYLSGATALLGGGQTPQASSVSAGSSKPADVLAVATMRFLPNGHSLVVVVSPEPNGTPAAPVRISRLAGDGPS